MSSMDSNYTKKSSQLTLIDKLSRLSYSQTLKLLGTVRHPILSSVVYLAMGWTILVAVRPMVQRMPPAGLLWLVLGGLAYTGGIIFFAMEKIRYGHFIWHLFVMTGTTFHVLAVTLYGQ